jgi:predicted transcriptional regulator
MPDESVYITDARVRSMKTAGKAEHEIAEELGVTTMDVEEALIRTMPISKLEEKP